MLAGPSPWFLRKSCGGASGRWGGAPRVSGPFPGGGWYLHRRPAAPVLRFALTPPEHTSYPGTPSVSPDGRFLTFSAMGPEGQRMLWLRPLDALHANVIPGTEGGFAPFWSPDSNFIAFFRQTSR